MAEFSNSYNCITEYRISLVTSSPLYIGSGEKDRNEILVHPITEVPFIQASGIAGALRDASVRVNGQEKTDTLFGSAHFGKNDSLEDVSSRVRITDAVFGKDQVPMEFRPRVAIDPKSGTVSESTIGGSGRKAGHKFDIELIGSGAEGAFGIYLYHQQNDGLKEELENVLAELRDEKIQFGGQKSNGGGFVTIKSLRSRTFAMEKAEDRKAWREETYDPGRTDSKGWGKDILQGLSDAGSSTFAYQIRLKAKTDGEMLIKGLEVAESGDNKEVAVNIKNADDKFIIPGSSLKGALRSRADILAGLLDKELLIRQIFGEAGKSSDTGTRGCVVVRDAVVGEGKSDKEIEHEQTRIHIDKFTGGVMNTGLFAQRNIHGDFNISIDIIPGKDADAAAGLMLLVLRDLAAGAFNLGSGYSIGKGFVDVETLEIQAFDGSSDRRSSINFKTKKISDENGIITKCLKAVNDWKEQ